MAATATIRMLLRDDDLSVGEFVCPPGDPRWDCENDIGEGFHVVFPWTPVRIARHAQPELVATPNHAVLYPPLHPVPPSQPDRAGDHCLFAVLSPAMCNRFGLPAGRSRLADPILTPAVWLGQRLLAEYLMRPGNDPAVARAIAGMVVAAALRSASGAAGEAAGGAVEHTKELMATSPGHLVLLSQAADSAHYSRFHLLRAFHARTGYTLHQYHLHLRLRRSVDLVLSGVPLADVALGLGFRGHSHFTSRFHRAFGETPSAVRCAAVDGAGLPDLIGRLLAAA